MATAGFTGASIGSRNLASFEGIRPSTVSVKVSSLTPTASNLSRRAFRGLVVKAATVVSPKYTSVKPLGDRVLVKVKIAEEKSAGGILLPTTSQEKPQSGEVVTVGDGKIIGKNKVEPVVKPGAKVVYSKYAGTELEFSGSKHMLLKEDDLVGLLETDDIKDLSPLNDRVLIKATVAEKKTEAGLFLTDASKEKPSIGTVIAVGPGPLDEEGKSKPLTVSTGNTVLYSKYAGSDFKGSGGDYIVLKASDIMAILS